MKLCRYCQANCQEVLNIGVIVCWCEKVRAKFLESNTLTSQLISEHFPRLISTFFEKLFKYCLVVLCYLESPAARYRPLCRSGPSLTPKSFVCFELSQIFYQG